MAPVEIVEYRDTWPDAFRTVAQELAGAMAGFVVAIEHIGSTSVPGLCAKPVIDVLLGVNAMAEVESRISNLSDLGYTYRPEHEVQIPQRRYFVKQASSATPRIHVHALLAGGPLWRDHLAFRNALRGDMQLAERYARLKKELAFRLSKSAYTEAKGPFIQRVLQTLASGKAENVA